MDSLAIHLQSLDPLWVYFAITAIAYIENIFPPFPSDVLVVAAGSLIVFGKMNFLVVLLLAAVGSTLGFMTMYQIGKWLDVKVIEEGKLKFIPLEKLHTVEQWFQRYGYGVVIANRFLAGTRAVVAFFAGMSNLPFTPTVLLSFGSSLLWNVLLLLAGVKLGENWHSITFYLGMYGKIITSIVVAVIVFFVLRQIVKNRKNKR